MAAISKEQHEKKKQQDNKCRERSKERNMKAYLTANDSPVTKRQRNKKNREK